MCASCGRMMTFFHWFVAVYLVISDVHTFYSLPTIDDNAIDYLRNFGYLPQRKALDNHLSANDILHEDTLTNAVKLLQKFGAIEQTGVIDAATKELLKKPRCGRPDIETPETLSLDVRVRRHKRYALMGAKWDKTKLTWAFMNKQHPRRGPEYEQIRRLIHEAMDVWQHNSNLEFEEVNSADANNADIRIDFGRLEHGDRFPFTGPGETLAHAFPPGDELGGDVHLDNDEQWDIEDGKGGDVNFFFTLLHELGHSLGLSHSSIRESIMYAWYDSTRVWDRKCGALYEDDVHGIAQHYGTKPLFKSGIVCKDNSYPHKPTKVPTRTTHRSNHVDVQTYRPDQPRYRPTPRAPYYPDQDPRRTNSPDRRRPHQETTREPYYPPKNPKDDEKPNKCDTSYDAIGLVRQELWIIKGRWFWRLMKDESGKYKPISEEPYLLGGMWSDLSGLDRIDAIFEMRDNNIAFFSGRKVYIHNGRNIVGVADVKHYGFDHSLKKVDAILRWGHKNKTFVFNGDRYWRVDDNLRVDLDDEKYPRKIGHPFWQGLSDIEVDTAITFNGKTYFISGLFTYEFDGYAKLRIDKPMLSSEFWMGCKIDDEVRKKLIASPRVSNPREEVDVSSAPRITKIDLFIIFLLSFSRVML